jgi:hypothetical protein
VSDNKDVPAHSQTRKLTETIAYPEHDPRKASSEYRKVHHHLVYELDEACWICGVRNSTLSDLVHNPKGAKQMETHHWRVEWAECNAVDPVLVMTDFPTMGAADEPHLRQWLDNEGNMLVLCDVDHRAGLEGIHSVTYPAWVVQRYLANHDVTKPQI